MVCIIKVNNFHHTSEKLKALWNLTLPLKHLIIAIKEFCSKENEFKTNQQVYQELKSFIIEI